MKTYKLNEIAYKRILGRTVKDAGNSDKPVPLFWGAAAVEFNVKAKEVWVKLSSKYDTHEPWVGVEVNGFRTGRFMVPAGEPKWYCITANMNPEKENLVTLIKDTQPMSGEASHSLFIHEAGLSEEGTFCQLKPRKLNIEFIGDSITSGEGLAGNPDEMDWITQWFCAGNTYARKVCKELDANWSMFSQCGWGICWGWDGNRNSVMPAHYNKVCSVMWGDYQKSIGAHEDYAPSTENDFVVLNLGTNDNGAFNQPAWKDSDGKEYVLTKTADGKACESAANEIINGAVAFLKNIRKTNPSAKIIWTWGMIKLDVVPELIAKAVEQYKKESGDSQVYLLELEAMEDVEVTMEDKGSRGHPGPKTHNLAAKRIVDFIKTL